MKRPEPALESTISARPMPGHAPTRDRILSPRLPRGRLRSRPFGPVEFTATVGVAALWFLFIYFVLAELSA